MSGKSQTMYVHIYHEVQHKDVYSLFQSFAYSVSVFQSTHSADRMETNKSLRNRFSLKVKITTPKSEI